MKRLQYRLFSMLPVFLVLALVVALPPAVDGRSADDQILTQKTFIDLAKKVRPAVVSIKINVKTLEKIEELRRERQAQPRRPDRALPPEFEDLPEMFKKFFQDMEPNMPAPQLGEELFRYPYGAGSGFIVRPNGYIVTNRHVLFHPMMVDQQMFKEGQITVVLGDGREFTGSQVKFIAADSLTDLAVLKIEAEGLPALKWGDSDGLEIGEWVMAVGDPLELTGSISQGIISGREREIEVAGYVRLLQTDAVINPGNSGGPLINLDGEVVGVNMAIASNTRFWQGVGFAIPSAVARKVTDDLIDRGHPVRGHIGITMTTPEEFPSLAAHEGFEGKSGVGVKDAYEGYPAYEGGLRSYDIIVEVDGKEVKDNAQVQRLITQHSPGDEIKFKVFRDKQYKTIAVKAGEWPDEKKLMALVQSRRAAPITPPAPKGEAQKGRIGLGVEDYPSDPNAPEDKKGVVIRRIEPGSAAAGAQPAMRVGDVIVEVEKERVRNSEQFVEAVQKRLKEAEEEKPRPKKREPTLMLRVERGNADLLVHVPLPTE